MGFDVRSCKNLRLQFMPEELSRSFMGINANLRTKLLDRNDKSVDSPKNEFSVVDTKKKSSFVRFGDVTFNNSFQTLFHNLTC